MENHITINGKEYAVKAGMKAIIVFEKLNDKAFEIKTTTDLLAYIYSAILASNPDAQLDFDELITAFDEDPELLSAASDMVLKRSAMSKVVALSNEDEDGGTESKKG